MAAAYRQYLRNKRKRRACWTKQWILRRQKREAHHVLMAEFSRVGHESYRNFVRMTLDNFTELLMRVSPLILVFLVLKKLCNAQHASTTFSTFSDSSGIHQFSFSPTIFSFFVPRRFVEGDYRNGCLPSVCFLVSR